MAGVNHLRPKLLFEQLAEAKGNVEHEIFFQEAIGADGAGIVATMAGIDDNLSDL